MSDAGGAPAVDLGIPTRGGGPYLAEAVESVLAQTHERWTLTISENGPGDPQTAAALAPYLDDPRVRHEVVGEDVGAARNHTRLARAGSAPFLAILHDDDRWEPTFLARRLEFLARHPDCGFVFSPHVVIGADGRPVRRLRAALPEGLHAPRELVPRLVRKNIVGVTTVVLRRSALEAVGSEFADDLLFFDYELWLRLAWRFPTGFVHAWDAAYRVHVLRETDRRRLLMGEEWLRVLDAFERSLGDGAAPAELRRARASALAYAALDAVERGERDRALELVRGVVASPSSLLRPGVAFRTAAAAGGAALGGRGARLLGRARAARWRAGMTR